MAGPVYRTVGTRSTSASTATISPAKPATVSAGGLLLAIVTSKNNDVHSCATSGWNLVGQVNSGASFTASLWRATETAGAPTITWLGAVAASAQIACYNDPVAAVDTALGNTTNSNGTVNPHTTSAITTTRDNSLAVYIDVAAANTAIATPAGWAENVDAGSATDGGRTAWGSKAIPTSGSSSGAISVTGAAAAWVQWQVEVLAEVPPANTAEFSKAEVNAWLDPVSGADFSKAEINAWLDASPTPPAGSGGTIMLSLSLALN